MVYTWGLLTTYESWDDPPSITLWEGEEMSAASSPICFFSSLDDLDGVFLLGSFSHPHGGSFIDVLKTTHGVDATAGL